jgi:hypothetical protein
MRGSDSVEWTTQEDYLFLSYGAGHTVAQILGGGDHIERFDLAGRPTEGFDPLILYVSVGLQKAI